MVLHYTSQMLHFVQMEDKTLHQQKDCQYYIVVVGNRTRIFSVVCQLYATQHPVP